MIPTTEQEGRELNSISYRIDKNKEVTYEEGKKLFRYEQLMGHLRQATCGIQEFNNEYERDMEKRLNEIASYFGKAPEEIQKDIHKDFVLETEIENIMKTHNILDDYFTRLPEYDDPRDNWHWITIGPNEKILIPKDDID